MSELTQLLNCIYGKRPASGKYDKREAEAGERLLRVHHVTLARAAELMDFVIRCEEWRERIHNARDLERAISHVTKAYDLERAKAQRQRERVGRPVSEMERLDTMFPGAGFSPTAPAERLRAEIKRLMCAGVRGPNLKRALEIWQKQDEEESA